MDYLKGERGSNNIWLRNLVDFGITVSFLLFFNSEAVIKLFVFN